MHGNVYEWCEDGYKKMGSGKQDAVKANSRYRALRGGSFDFDTDWVRSSHRTYDTPGTTFNNIGFRVARFPL